MSFYDWYCDLPPSPRRSGASRRTCQSRPTGTTHFIIAWGSNVRRRARPTHFFTEVRYKGAKTVAVTPDYSEVAKLADLWMHPKQGTDAAVAMAMGHVILKDSTSTGRRSAYFDDYCRKIHRHADARDAEGTRLASGERFMVPDADPRVGLQRQPGPGQQPGVEDRSRSTRRGKVVLPNGAIGFRAGARRPRRPGQWNLEAKEARHGNGSSSSSLLEGLKRPGTETREVSASVLRRHRVRTLSAPSRASVLVRTVPGAAIALKEGDGEALVATVFDLFRLPTTASRAACRANLWRRIIRRRHALTRRPGRSASPGRRAPGDRRSRASSPRTRKTEGKSMVIIGAAMNHWYHSDMNYRGIINMLMMCGCIGRAAAAGRTTSARRSCARRPAGRRSRSRSTGSARRASMNSTSFFYATPTSGATRSWAWTRSASPLADSRLRPAA